MVTDIRMPPSKSDEGIQVAALLRETRPEVGVVVLSQYSEPGYALALLESGSDARALPAEGAGHDRGQLVGAVEAVARGGSVIDPRVVEALVASKARAESSPLADLTPREREVLAEIAQGKSNSRHRRVARPHEASRREAHQLDLPEARPRGGRGRQQARQGRARLSGGGGGAPPRNRLVPAPPQVPCPPHCRTSAACDSLGQTVEAAPSRRRGRHRLEAGHGRVDQYSARAPRQAPMSRASRGRASSDASHQIVGER